MKTKPKANPARQRIALVLQGGGALGAYQAGVFQALHEHDLSPDWIVGTSIGAINAAIIAGNHPDVRLKRLKEFWTSVASHDWIALGKLPDQARQFSTWLATVNATLSGVPGFFAPRFPNPFAVGLPTDPEKASFYDTSVLADTLGKLVDLDYLNTPGGMRLTVNALQVTRGQLTSFDNQQQRIGIEHILASGALPPGFPPVRIDGELYWDGGLFSNTPLETVLDDEPRVNTLCFMVDLWNASGPEPRTFDEVETRQKDVTLASRSQSHIDDYLRMHKLRQSIRKLHARLPPELKDAEDIHELAAIGASTTLHIMRLVYGGHDWHMASKDMNFSEGSLEWRWEQGYLDTTSAIKGAPWTASAPGDAGIVVHEVSEERLRPVSRPATPK